MKKLAIITSHPIQYYAPAFRLLRQRQKIDIMVFYTWGEASLKKHDPGFNKKIQWDIPLLDGYPFQWVKNVSADPGTHHFNGIKNPDLTRQVSDWQPDAVLIYGWGFSGHLKALRYFKNKIPVLFRGDSTLLDDEKGARSFLKTRFLKWVYQHVDHAFYPGANTKAYFQKYGLKDGRLSFAPHAIDNERFAEERAAEAISLRTAQGLKAGDIVILFAGKLEEKKSPLLLLSSFINLNRPGCHLLFVGNGPLEQELKSKAAGHGNIHFIDFQNQSQMPVVYQACDLFCLPSAGPGETWGLAINEAMASGKAILSSDKVGSAVDLVRPGRNGDIFKANDAGSLTEKLDALTKNGTPGLREFGVNSKKIIENWTFENQVKVIEEVVNNG
ncbi:MAG TPA: glycosyltransferase family 4 protein [Mucilaginibacter sp.]|jgi:glycosyltransferase involved in cell wall biosynthesis|nr:glycosyltransferase family 4 protein [Mucilaginibacter sp.]